MEGTRFPNLTNILTNCGYSDIGISYYLHENVSGLQNVVTSAITAAWANSSNTDVNALVNALEGMISIGGGAEYDYITTNYPFDLPNTFAPRAESYGLVTEHSHLFDNSQISSITLTGTTEEGDSATHTLMRLVLTGPPLDQYYSVKLAQYQGSLLWNLSRLQCSLWSRTEPKEYGLIGRYQPLGAQTTFIAIVVFQRYRYEW